MRTSWKPLAQRKLAAEFKRWRESIEDDGRSGRLKDATANENVKVVHTLVLCDRTRDLRSGYTFWGSTINPYPNLWYVKGFRKTGAGNVDQ